MIKNDQNRQLAELLHISARQYVIRLLKIYLKIARSVLAAIGGHDSYLNLITVYTTKDVKFALNYLNKCTPDEGRNGNTQFRASNSLCTHHTAELINIAHDPTDSRNVFLETTSLLSNFLNYNARTYVRTYVSVQT